MIFKTKQELLKQARKDGACCDGLEWAEAQESLEEIRKTCPLEWRIWALCNGYDQFAEHMDWNNLSGRYWSWLLSDRPEFAEHCTACSGWKKLNGWRWSELLRVQRQFEVYCEWGKLNDRDWRWLLAVQPQFAEKRQELENR